MYNRHEWLNMKINKTNVLYAQVKLRKREKKTNQIAGEKIRTERVQEKKKKIWQMAVVGCFEQKYCIQEEKKMNVTIETHLKLVQNEVPVCSFNISMWISSCRLHTLYLIAIMTFCWWADSCFWKCNDIHILMVWLLLLSLMVTSHSCWKEFVVHDAKVKELKIHGIGHKYVFFVLEFVFYCLLLAKFYHLLWLNL